MSSALDESLPCAASRTDSKLFRHLLVASLIGDASKTDEFIPSISISVLVAYREMGSSNLKPTSSLLRHTPTHPKTVSKDYIRGQSTEMKRQLADEMLQGCGVCSPRLMCGDGFDSSTSALPMIFLPPPTIALSSNLLKVCIVYLAPHMVE